MSLGSGEWEKVALNIPSPPHPPQKKMGFFEENVDFLAKKWKFVKKILVLHRFSQIRREIIKKILIAHSQKQFP